MTTLQAGDKCWVQGRKKHYGICSGYDDQGRAWFIHNVPGRGVVETLMIEFAGRKQTYIEKRAAPGFEDVVVQRARAHLGQQYELLFFNCEHLANLAADGKKQSPQLQERVFWTSVALIAARALSGDGTHVDSNGYRRDKRGRFA